MTIRKREVGSQKSEVASDKPSDRNLTLMVLRFLFALPVLLTMACGSGETSNNENVHSRLDTNGLQRFSAGQRLYTKYCQNCHAEDGQGLGRLIPPLKNSDYLLNNVAASARTIKYGLRGPIVVNGIEYNQPMPANPDLTSLEITELLVFISNAWGNETKPITLEEVEAVVPNQ